MSKPAKERKLADHQAQAILKALRTSPRKLGLVAGMIRGKKVDQALAELTFCRKRIAESVKKVLMSAVSNAENNHNLDIDQLYVDQVLVGKSLVMKRFRARARGRGARIEKPFSNLTVIVAERKETA